MTEVVVTVAKGLWKGKAAWYILHEAERLEGKETAMKRLIGAILISALVITGCMREADVASHNVSVAADQFEVLRRVVFFNGITDTYLLTIEGLCSLGNNDKSGELTVTCKVGPTSYKKHFLGLSDNVSYFVEQLDAAKVNTYHYRVTFRPSTIIPDLDIR